MSARIIDLCGEALCMNEAAWSFVWPGRRRAFICEGHFAKLKATAAALGLSPESLDVQRCPLLSEQIPSDVDTDGGRFT